MTAPNNPDPVPREMLAAYADGELDAADRAAVEQWLAAHPEALPELQAQRELSPANAGLWERAEPPEPSPTAWANVRRAIADALSSPANPARLRWRAAAWSLGGLAVAGVAAAIAWIVLSPSVPPPEQPAPTAKQPPEVAPHPRDREPPPTLVAGFAVLPIATDEDVILERVPETRALLLVGRHPLPPLLVLASIEEVELEEVAPNPLWPTGVPRMTVAPGDAPMIFATKPR